MGARARVSPDQNVFQSVRYLFQKRDWRPFFVEYLLAKHFHWSAILFCPNKDGANGSFLTYCDGQPIYIYCPCFAHYHSESCCFRAKWRVCWFAGTRYFRDIFGLWSILANITLLSFFKLSGSGIIHGWQESVNKRRMGEQSKPEKPNFN